MTNAHQEDAVTATAGTVTVTLTRSQIDGYWFEEWAEDGVPFGDRMLTPLYEATAQEHTQAAADRLAR